MWDKMDESPPVQPEESHPTETEPKCPIVGIGASAGGIDALRRLFPNVAPDCDMAFVVVQHLDPDHGSLLAEVLARSTSLPVTQIAEETMVEHNHVYVIPPNAVLTIREGRLRLAHPVAPRGQRNPIDEFFTSLARDQGENAACVILSGTGSDGTLGLRAIKEGGGLTLAQSEAEYDGMMRSAVATGLVDFVLRVEEIPAKLVDYFSHLSRLEDHEGNKAPQARAADYLDQITAILRAQTGHDFSDYKDRTILRRVQRRMHVLQIDDVAAFVERLRHDSHEVDLLFQDLLIGVTNFFRDPEAFATLEREVIPNLFKDKGPGDTVRVWVPGCATGEEAYSIAILLREHTPKSERKPKLQIFASDIDSHALDIARIGRYPATIAKDVPPSRLERYFLREDGTYRITGELRQICLFSLHNLLRDAPFSKLDLISCRNLLIYLSADLQDRVIPLFHYSLLPNGYLFLGTSENVTRHSRLFMTVDNTHRIFRSRAHQERRIPEFPLTAPDASRRSLPPTPYRTASVEPSLKETAERQLLERFAPAFVVINAEGDLLQSSGRTGKYLELPPGAPDTNIFNMARSGLRLDLRAAVHRAISSGQSAVQPKVNIGTNGGRQEIDLYVQPLRFGGPSSEMLYMVVFQDLGGIKPIVDAEVTESPEVEEANVRQLEAELGATKERLQTTTEELESSNEELRSSNEELQLFNEELQSTNEELETSKEELQSINEELQTVNAELNARVEELGRANNDIRNLLESTQIATVFLDRSLTVKSFTPAAKDVFWLVESDVGRPIMHVRSRFESDTIQQDAERVLRTLGTTERTVRSNENDTLYVMRTLPYRTTDNVISGVVITFIDITRISAAEARIGELTSNLRTRINELETILDLIPVGVIIGGSEESQEVMINSYGARLLHAAERRKGLRPVPVQFRLFEGDKELPRESQPLERAARTGEGVSNWEGQLENQQGDRVHVMISATPLFTEAGGIRGAVAVIVDISQHKHAEAQQQFLLGELQHRVKNILATIVSLGTRMARRQSSAEEFRGAFLDRLFAMGRTHDLLTTGAWSGTNMRSLVEAALAPHVTTGKGAIVLDGPEIRLAAGPATTLGMVFHELATNAAKYGALSKADGRVDVSWKLLDDKQTGGQRLELNWTEADGPRVDDPGQSGFGTSFITRSVEYELGGKANLDFTPEGLRCKIEIPYPGAVEQHSPAERT
jgi:two-component system, chemotaxis family, CheB/CheR fusion protein